jgi:hypothetical protein
MSPSEVPARPTMVRNSRVRHGIRDHAGLGTWIVLAAVWGVAGCGSFSDSSKSVSKIVSSPFTSSSRSSSPEAAYRDDIRDFTAAHVQSGGDAAGLIREIGSLAKKHGITDWENNKSTFQAVGQGLAKAGYRQLQVDAFKKNLASTPEQAKWLQDGYDSAR